MRLRFPSDHGIKRNRILQGKTFDSFVHHPKELELARSATRFTYVHLRTL
jgi:hypothetical protein